MREGLTSRLPASGWILHPLTRKGRIPSRREKNLAGICIHTSGSHERLERKRTFHIRRLGKR